MGITGTQVRASVEKRAGCLVFGEGARGGLGLGFMGRTVKRNLLNLKLKTLNRKRMND